MFFNEKKNINQIISKGKIYQIPFKFKWERNFLGEIKKTSLLELNQLNLKIKNISSIEKQKYSAESQIFITGKKLYFNYEIEDNLISFLSNNIELLNQNVEYSGKIQLDPFNFKIDINLNEVNFK